MFNDMQFTRQQRKLSVFLLFLCCFAVRRVFIVRSSKSDNGATIKKYFASILCTLFTRLIDDSSPHSLAMVCLSRFSTFLCR